MAEIDTARMIFRSMASEKVSNRSKNGLLSASNESFEVGAPPKSGAASNRDQLRVLLHSKKNFFFGENSPQRFPKISNLRIRLTWSPRWLRRSGRARRREGLAASASLLGFEMGPLEMGPLYFLRTELHFFGIQWYS